MIGRLTGTLYDKTPPRIGLEVQGVGYEVDVSMTTFYALPEIGSQVTLLTHLTVREDAHILFGFATAQETGSVGLGVLAPRPSRCRNRHG